MYILEKTFLSCETCVLSNCLLHNTTQNYSLWQPVPVRYRTRETMCGLLISNKAIIEYIYDSYNKMLRTSRYIKTDSKTHLVFVTCYKAWTDTVLKTDIKMIDVSCMVLKTMTCVSRFQSDIVRGKQFLSLLSLTRRENERMHAPRLLFKVIHVSY
jgi:hypothetical protein